MAEQELKACPIPRLHEAFNAIVRRASQGGAWTGTMPFMSIPARPDVDADLIVSSAIDELSELRSRLASAEAEVERLRKIAADAFGFLPVVPGDAMALVDSNIVPHVVRVADEYAIRSEQLRLSNAEVGRLGAIMLNLVRAMENEIDTRRCRDSSLHALNLARKEANTAAARRQQGGTDAR